MSTNRRLSTAIHILTALAYQAGKLTSSDGLAVGLRANPALVRRILSVLAQHGLVESYPGKGGGSRLAKPAAKIGLDEVYVAMRENPLFATFEKEPYAACPISCNVGKVLEGVYDDLERDLMKKMKRVKIDDLLREMT